MSLPLGLTAGALAIGHGYRFGSYAGEKASALLNARNQYRLGHDPTPVQYYANAIGPYQPSSYPIGPKYKSAYSKVASNSMASRSYTRSRRSRRRSRRRGCRIIRRPRPVSLMWPRFRLVKFRCVTSNSIADLSATGNLFPIVFKANSLNDPFGTIGSELPLGLDQWAAMYSKYVCVASRFMVQFHNQSSTGALAVGCNLKNDNTTLASLDHYRELPMVKSKILSPDVDHAGLGMSFKAKKFYRVRKFKDAENLHGTFSTSPGDPTDIAYYHFWVQDLNKADSFNLEFVATIEYVCLLFDPVTPARSQL